MSYNVTKSKLLVATSIFALGLPSLARADQFSDLKAELAIIQSQIKDMQAQSAHYSPEKRDELAQVKQEVAQLKAQLAVAETTPPPAPPAPAPAAAPARPVYPYNGVLAQAAPGTGLLPAGGTGALEPKVIKPVVGGVLLYANNGSAFFIAGTLDAGARVDTGAGHNVLSVQSGLMRTSRLTLEGYQNIGFGLRAVGVIEGGLNVSEGIGASNPNGITGFDFGRESFVGVGNDKYGYIDFGRQYSPIWSVSAAPVADPFAGVYLGGILALDPTLAVNSRVSNSITYNYRYTWEGMLNPAPPHGWGFAAMYTPPGNNGHTLPVNAGQQFGAAASYGGKHWWLGTGYHQIDGINLNNGEAPYTNTYIPTLPTTQLTRLVEITVAGSYLTPYGRLFAQVNTQYDGRKDALNDGVDQEDFMVGAVVPTFKHQNVRFIYGKLFNKTSTRAQYSVFQASYEYDLAAVPGTAVYLEGSMVANSANSAQGILGAADVGGTGPSAILPTQVTKDGTHLDYGATDSTIATGVRFIF
jgi:predicted porin